MMQESVPSL
jgi:Cdc6-like AAA superfamily ATPase